mmetsp:Transcript_113427/g.366459  ORF Transcript_113427/g.366459 Transcript_113427/m.366459 type:complete len:208 (-) Transcript_113427:21-644(-)
MVGPLQGLEDGRTHEGLPSERGRRGHRGRPAPGAQRSGGCHRAADGGLLLGAVASPVCGPEGQGHRLGDGPRGQQRQLPAPQARYGRRGASGARASCWGGPGRGRPDHAPGGGRLQGPQAALAGEAGARGHLPGPRRQGLVQGQGHAAVCSEEHEPADQALQGQGQGQGQVVSGAPAWRGEESSRRGDPFVRMYVALCSMLEDASWW